MRRVLAFAAHALFYLCVVAVLVGLLADYTFARRGWTTDAGRRLAAQELANYLGREVRVGPITGNLWRGATVEGISVLDAAGRPVLAARQVHVEWDLAAVLRRKQSFLESIRSIRVVDPYVRVAQDREGRLNLQFLVNKMTAKRPPAAKPPKLFVQVVGGTIDYDLRGDEIPAKLGRGRLQGINLTFDSRSPRVMTVAATLSSAGGPVRTLGVQCGYEPSTGAIGATGYFSGADVAALAALAPARAGVRVLSGAADGQFTVYRSGDEGKKGKIEWSANVVGHDLGLRVARVAGAISAPYVQAMVTPRDLWASAPTIRWGTSSTSLELSVHDFARPNVFARALGAKLWAPQLEAVVPATARKSLSLVKYSSWITGDVEVEGPEKHLDVDADLSASGPIEAHPAKGVVVAASGARLRVTANDLASPAAAFQATVTAPRIVSLPSVKLRGEEAVPRVRGLGDLAVTGSLADKTLVASSSVKAEGVALGEMYARNLQAHVDLDGPVFRLSGLTLDVAGGKVEGQALAGSAGEGLAAEVSFAGLDMATLTRWGLPAEGGRFAGTASGRARLGLGKDRVTGSAVVSAKDVKAESYPFDSVTALCNWDGQSLTFPWILANSRAGNLAATVAYDLGHRTLQGKFAVGPVNLADVAEQSGAGGWRGDLWTVGSFSGPATDPHLSADIALHHPGYGDQSGQAAFAHLEGGLRRIDLRQLTACRDGAVVSFSGALLDLHNEKPYGEVEGHLKARGLELGTLLSWAKRHVEGEPQGLMSVDADVAGTLMEPLVSGELRTARLTYGKYRAAGLAGPFRFSLDSLQWGPVNGFVEGVRTTLTAAVSDLGVEGKQPRIDVSASTRDTNLVRIPALRRRGLMLTGRGALRDAHVVWVGDHLESATAEAVLTDASLGDVRLSDTDLTVRTKGDVVSLEPTDISVAGGSCHVEGSYDTKNRTMKVAAGLKACELPTLLDGAAVAVPAVMSGPEEERAKVARRLESLSFRLAGPVTGDLALSGSTDAPVVKVDLHDLDLRLDNRSLPQTSVSATYLPEERRVQDVDVEAQSGEGLVTVNGFVDVGKDMRLVVDGSSLDVRRIGEWVPAMPPSTGTLDVTCLLTGTTSEPSIKGSFDVRNFTVSGARFDIATVPVFTLKEGGLDIDTMVIKRSNHEVTLHGHLPFTWKGPKVPTDQPVKFTASFAQVDLDMFRTLAREYLRTKYPTRPETALANLQVAGLADGSLDIGGTLAEPLISGGLDVNGAGFSPAGWTTPVRDGVLKLTMSPAKGGTLVTLAKLSAKYDKTSFGGSGTVLLTTTQTGNMLDNPIDLKFTASAPEQVLSGGTTARNLAFAASLKTVRPGLVRFAVDKGEAKLGGGKAVLKGGVDLTSTSWTRLADNKWDLQLDLDRARVSYGRMFDGEVGGSLRVATLTPGKAATVESKLVVTHAQVTPVTSAGGGALYGPPRSTPDFGLDLTAGIGGDVNVGAAGVSITLQPNATAFTVSGSLQTPMLNGAVSAKEGEAGLPGGFLMVRRLNVTVSVRPTVPAAVGPGGSHKLDLRAHVEGQAERTVSGQQVAGQPGTSVQIYLTFTGNLPGQINVKATSEPPLAEQQIYAILGAEPLGALTAGGSIGSALSERFVSLLGLGLRAGVFEPLEAQLRSLLGLSELSINFAFAQPVEVRIGKYLIKNMLVSYSRGLATGGERQWSFSMSYEVMPGTTVGYLSRWDGERRFNIGIRRTF